MLERVGSLTLFCERYDGTLFRSNFVGWLRNVALRGKVKLRNDEGTRLLRSEDLDDQSIVNRGGLYLDVEGLKAEAYVLIPENDKLAIYGHEAWLGISSGSRTSTIREVTEMCRAVKPAQGMFTFATRGHSAPPDFGLERRELWLADGGLSKGIIGKDGDGYWLGAGLAEQVPLFETAGIEIQRFPEGVWLLAKSADDRASLRSLLSEYLFAEGSKHELLFSYPHYLNLGELVPVEQAKDWIPLPFTDPFAANTD
jgi:hypothetical protein